MIPTSDVTISLSRNQIQFENVGAPEDSSPRELAREWDSAAYSHLLDAAYIAKTKIKYEMDHSAFGLFVNIGGVSFFYATRNGKRVISGWAGEGKEPFAAAAAAINETREEEAEGETFESENAESIKMAVALAFEVAEAADDAGHAAVAAEVAKLNAKV